MSDAPILAGVNRVADLDSAGDFEKKHTPYITCERQGDKVHVTVKVGHLVSHPNAADHFIEWIQVSVAGAPIARFGLAAVAVDPEVTCVLNVEPGTTVEALESCNLHGVWAASTVAP